MIENSYFYTWAAQSDYKALDVAKTADTYIYLKNGLRLDDLTSISFQASFGHSAKTIQDAIAKQLYEMPMAGPSWHSDLKDLQSLRLLNLLKLKGKIFYTTGGAEAVENALKIARQITKKNIILARKKSYHGATLGALSVTGDWRNAEHNTINEWTVRIPEPCEDPDLSQTRKIIETTGADKIAAFCLETISGTNGVTIPNKKWWQGIGQLCKEFGILLICDEVLVGFGRTGSAFAYQQYDLQPDFVTMSKGITGGYMPFGATFVTEKIAKLYDHKIFSCGLTNYAHPLGLAAMGAVIDFFDESNFSDNLGKLEKVFSENIHSLKSIHKIKDIRIAGMLAAIEFDSQDIVKHKTIFLHNGLHVFLTKNMIILAPALTYDKDSLVDALQRLRKSIEELVKLI
jgi:taurine---2-oxoglutarate transaminase